MNDAQSTALEICTKAEDRIRKAQSLLLETRPEALDGAVAELADVIGDLREVGKRPVDPSLRAPLQRIRTTASLLARQIEYASNLNLGFVQLRLAHGYTRQGLPLVHSSSARNSVEA